MQGQGQADADLSSSGDEYHLEEEWNSSSQLSPADVDTLMSIIECGICVDFLSDATETGCCHKLFCLRCIQVEKKICFCPLAQKLSQGWLAQRQTCPVCRAALRVDMLTPNVVLQRFVDGMSVDCSFGCAQKPSRSDLESHLRVCELRPELVARQKQERQVVLASRVAKANQVLQKKRKTAFFVLMVAVAVECFGAGGLEP